MLALRFKPMIIYLFLCCSVVKAQDSQIILNDWERICSNAVADHLVWKEAIKSDNEAQYYMGSKLTDPSCAYKERQIGLSFLLEAAKAHHEKALYTVGILLLDVSKDVVEDKYALAHLKKSAELDYSPAQSLLGAILLSRAKSKIQQNEAINLLKRAAFSGEIEAAMTLHHGFENGIHFIEKNQCEAKFWLSFAHHIDTGSTEFLENMIKPCEKKIH